MDAAEMESTEKDAIEAVKKSFRRRRSLPQQISAPARISGEPGAAPSRCGECESAGFLDSDLANGMKNGYAIRYVIVGASTLGAPAKYALAATPLQYGAPAPLVLPRFEWRPTRRPTGEERSAAKLIPKWSRTPCETSRLNE